MPGISGHVDVDAMEWQSTPFPGIRIKILFQEPDGEGFTALFQACMYAMVIPS